MPLHETKTNLEWLYAEPNGYATVVDDTIFSICSDSEVGEKYGKLKNRAEKRASFWSMLKGLSQSNFDCKPNVWL